jgi:hypothetical protein
VRLESSRQSRFSRQANPQGVIASNPPQYWRTLFILCNSGDFRFLWFFEFEVGYQSHESALQILNLSTVSIFILFDLPNCLPETINEFWEIRT